VVSDFYFTVVGRGRGGELQCDEVVVLCARARARARVCGGRIRSFQFPTPNFLVQFADDMGYMATQDI
jgi:hypothetical protein